MMTARKTTLKTLIHLSMEEVEETIVDLHSNGGNSSFTLMEKMSCKDFEMHRLDLVESIVVLPEFEHRGCVIEDWLVVSCSIGQVYTCSNPPKVVIGNFYARQRSLTTLWGSFATVGNCEIVVDCVVSVLGFSFGGSCDRCATVVCSCEKTLVALTGQQSVIGSEDQNDETVCNTLGGSLFIAFRKGRPACQFDDLGMSPRHIWLGAQLIVKSEDQKEEYIISLSRYAHYSTQRRFSE